MGIRDVVTFQGRTVDEVEKAFHESVDDYLAFCVGRGQKPEKACSGQFVVRINSELHRKANILASASGKSLNAWVAECLDKQVRSKMPETTASVRGGLKDVAAGRTRPARKAVKKLARAAMGRTSAKH